MDRQTKSIRLGLAGARYRTETEKYNPRREAIPVDGSFLINKSRLVRTPTTLHDLLESALASKLSSGFGFMWGARTHYRSDHRTKRTPLAEKMGQSHLAL